MYLLQAFDDDTVTNAEPIGDDIVEVDEIGQFNGALVRNARFVDNPNESATLHFDNGALGDLKTVIAISEIHADAGKHSRTENFLWIGKFGSDS